MKAPSPLLGFNNNFKHKGQVYHVQTEDSGIKYQHIITHLFADGGRILKSIKTSYASLVGDPAMADHVRTMMKEQHKAMIIALRDGAFDPGGSREVKLPQTGLFASATNAGTIRRTSGDDVPATGKSSPELVAVSPAAQVNEPLVPPVDVKQLERAAMTAVPASPPVLPQPDLPPPPANMIASGQSQRPQGGYRSVTGRPPDVRKSTPPPAAVPSPSRASRPPSGRYAPSRPASMFATSKPSKQSLFGDDLISERSLDEVILAYLAEDLEGEGSPKK